MRLSNNEEEKSMKKRLMSTVLCTSLAASMLCCVGVQAEENQKFENPVKLTYLTWQYADRTPSTDAWIEGCKEKFNIEIELQNTPNDNYEAMFLTKFAADDLPDLVSVHKVAPDYKTEGGAQIDENTFVDISDLENIGNFSEDTLEGVKIDGKLYYVPVAQNALGVLYNKKVFEENGLEIPTNIDEFMSVMNTLKDNGVTPLAGSFSEVWSAQIIPFIAWDNYVGRKDPEAAQKLYDCRTDKSSLRWTGLEGAEETFALTQKWVDEGYFTEEPLSTDASVACQLLATGDAAMFITGSWEYSVAAEACDDGVEIGFFPLPLNENGEELYVPSTAVEGMCINAKSENVEAAQIAMNYYLSQEIQQLVTDDLNGIATHKEVSLGAFASEVRDAVNNNKRMFPSLYTKSCGYTIPADSTLYTGIAQEFQNILIGKITPAELCEKLDETTAEVAIVE